MRRLRARLVPALAVFVAVLAGASAAGAAKGPKPSDLLVGDALPPVTEQDRALTSVPFGPGAPAVVLLEARQYGFEDAFVRYRFMRRIKILTEAGVTEHGDVSQEFYGDWRMGTTKARVILPDGTEVDAAPNVHVESSKDPDTTTITVTFPKVQVGAILDFAMEANYNSSFVSISEYEVQESLPVVQKRFLLMPRADVRYRSATVRLPPESVEQADMRYGQGTLFAWTFRNIKPLPAVPNMPPTRELAQKLVLIPESYDVGGIALPIAADWKTWCRDMGREWDAWMKKKSPQCTALAQQVTQGAATPRDKAEAVRKALRERMTRSWSDSWPTGDTPDESLAQARGNSADIAGVAATMLRAAGVPVRLTAYRYRSSGTLPLEVPAPNMIDDVLVTIPGAGEGGGDLHVSMWSDLPAGLLPLNALGVHVVPMYKDSPGPVFIPDAPSDKNAVERTVNLALTLEGNVTGDARITARGPRAQVWRKDLAALSAEDRKKSLESDLHDYMPTAVLTTSNVENLEDASKDLVVTLAWEAQGYAQRAGGRLLLNPFVFSRVSASDWGAETREIDVWLGRPSLTADTVSITMPQGIAKVQLPAPQKLEAGQVGGYEIGYSGKDMKLQAFRRLRFDQTMFPASSYAPLRSWFQDMATGDDQSIVFTLAEP